MPSRSRSVPEAIAGATSASSMPGTPARRRSPGKPVSTDRHRFVIIVDDKGRGDCAREAAMTELPFLDRDGRVTPPPKRRLLGEMRAVLTPRPRLARLPALQAAPRGDGHPVFVLPGFLTNDGRTRHLRTFLSRLGYAVYGWGRGVNWGP